MSEKQERYIETVGAGSQRPYYKVVAPAEWTDDQIKDAFREATKKLVGYLQPKGQHGCAGGSKFPLVDVIFLEDVHRETLAAVNAAPPLPKILEQSTARECCECIEPKYGFGSGFYICKICRKPIVR